MTKARDSKSGKPAAKPDREQRLKAALKANIARRKAQARLRKTSGERADESKN